MSVIIPTHNRSRQLVRAVNSVISQTYNSIEIIIVNDGSIDDTSSILMRFKKSDSRIRIF